MVRVVGEREIDFWVFHGMNSCGSLGMNYLAPVIIRHLTF